MFSHYEYAMRTLSFYNFYILYIYWDLSIWYISFFLICTYSDIWYISFFIIYLLRYLRGLPLAARANENMSKFQRSTSWKHLMGNFRKNISQYLLMSSGKSSGYLLQGFWKEIFLIDDFKIFNTFAGQLCEIGSLRKCIL